MEERAGARALRWNGISLQVHHEWPVLPIGLRGSPRGEQEPCHTGTMVFLFHSTIEGRLLEGFK